MGECHCGVGEGAGWDDYGNLIDGYGTFSYSVYSCEKVESSQHLVNKLWNISRFILMSVEKVESIKEVEPKTLADKWILSRLAQVTQKVTKHFDEFEFSLAGETLREFTWADFAVHLCLPSKRYFSGGAYDNLEQQQIYY